MLASIIRNEFFHAALTSLSNQPIVFMGASLIWAIILLGIAIALFLNHIAHSELSKLCVVGKNRFISFLGEFF